MSTPTPIHHQKQFYFSGIDRADYFQWVLDECKIGAYPMVNALALSENTETKLGQLIINSGAEFIPRFLESGAFQGRQTIENYSRVVSVWASHFSVIANLDVIGDQKSSDKNFTILHKISPKVLWILQAADGSLAELDSRTKDFKFVGIGGLVPLIRGPRLNFIRYINDVGNILSKNGAKAHFFGVTSPTILMKFRAEDWFQSADSSSWVMMGARRQIMREDGATIHCGEAGFKFSLKEIAQQNIRITTDWFYSRQPRELSLI